MKIPCSLHFSDSVQIEPPSSGHVLDEGSKSSSVLPSGRMNRLRGIDSVFCFPYWVYSIFIVFVMCPGFSGENVIDRLWVPLGGIDSISSISMNSTSDENCMFVISSSPKLKSSILIVRLSPRIMFSKISSGFCFRSRFCVIGNVSFVICV